MVTRGRAWTRAKLKWIVDQLSGPPSRKASATFFKAATAAAKKRKADEGIISMIHSNEGGLVGRDTK